VSSETNQLSPTFRFGPLSRASYASLPPGTTNLPPAGCLRPLWASDRHLFTQNEVKGPGSCQEVRHSCLYPNRLVGRSFSSDITAAPARPAPISSAILFSPSKTAPILIHPGECPTKGASPACPEPLGKPDRDGLPAKHVLASRRTLAAYSPRPSSLQPVITTAKRKRPFFISGLEGGSHIIFLLLTRTAGQPIPAEGHTNHRKVV